MHETWTFKCLNFSKFQNVISDSSAPPPCRDRYYEALRIKLDMYVTNKGFFEFCISLSHLYRESFTVFLHFMAYYYIYL